MIELARATVPEGTSSVEIAHCGGVAEPKIRVLYQGQYRPDLIDCVVPTPGNARNACTVYLTQEVQATIQVLALVEAAAMLPLEEVASIRESAQFGAALFHSELASRLQESSTDWVTVLSLSAPATLVGGTYAIAWSFAWKYSHTQRKFHTQVLLTKTGEDPVVLISYAQKSCGDKCPTHGETFQELADGEYDLALQAKASHQRDWYRIDERSIRVWRAR